MGTRLTNKNMVDWLILNTDGITLVGEYKNNRTKTDFMCNHGHIWNTTPKTIRSGKGCPICYGNIRSDLNKLSKTEVIEWLAADNRGFRLVGDYADTKTKVVFECRMGHQWGESVNHIKSGRGCPQCSSSGFRSHLPGWFYIIKFNDFIKYGITHNMKRRFRDHRDLLSGNYGELYFSHFYNSGNIAAELESLVRKTYGGRYMSKDRFPSGYTETLPLELLDSVMSLLRENTQIETLNTSQGIT
jgi:hypothetical protein